MIRYTFINENVTKVELSDGKRYRHVGDIHKCLDGRYRYYAKGVKKVSGEGFETLAACKKSLEG